MLSCRAGIDAPCAEDSPTDSRVILIRASHTSAGFQIHGVPTTLRVVGDLRPAASATAFIMSAQFILDPFAPHAANVVAMLFDAGIMLQP